MSAPVDELHALILGQQPARAPAPPAGSAPRAAPAPAPEPAPASGDELYSLILGRQPAAAPAAPAPGRAAPALTSPQQQGVSDLRDTVGQMRERLADTKPGTATHKRLTSDIAEAEREIARMTGMAVPAAPAAPAAPAVPAAPETEAAPPGVASVAQRLFGGLQAGGAVVGGALSAVPAGFAGLYKLATTGSPEQAAQAVEATQGAIMQPLVSRMTPTGQEYAAAVGRGMEFLNTPAVRIGEATLGATGSPAAATAAEIVLNPLNLVAAALPAKAALTARGARPGAAAAEAATPGAALPGGAAILTPEQTIAAQTVPTVAERMARAQQMGAPAAPAAAAGVPAAAGGAAVPAAAAAGAAGAAGQPAPFGSVGAAAATRGASLDTAIAMATPELRTTLETVRARGGRINQQALDRHLEADSLPIPVRLTEGQATGDIVKISDEFNKRGQPGGEAIAYRLKNQNDALQQNLVAIRDSAAPNVYGTNVVENGQSLINAYKAIDETRNLQIRSLYRQLEDAAGGRFPVDGKAFVADADRLLGKKLKTEFVPPTIRRQMDQFREQPMTFEQFEALRTNLASEIRKAERAGDGNAEMALSLVRQSLENLPMTGADAVRLKALADQARAAARARFQMLEKDPAYKAAVNDKVAADDFVNKFVISGKKQNIQTMVDQFGRGSDAHQVMAAGTINWLRGKAGIVGEGEGNFSQAGYNKALQTLEPRLLDLMEAEQANQLRTLGNVARYTQQQRTGSFVGTSSTATALLRAGVGKAVGAVEQAVPVVGPLVGAGREAMAKRAAQQEIADMLKPGAGIEAPKKGKKVKDIAAEGVTP